MNQNQNNEPSKADALKIATAYAFAGGLWILCSCFLSSYLIYDEYATFLLECGKGLLYVLVTAILLGWLLNHYCYKIRCTTELLSKSETRFKSFFEHPIAAVGLVRMRDGVFVDVNNAFARLHGYTREQIIGCTSEELQLWPSAERHQLIAELLENKTQVLPMQSLRKDSTVLSFLGAVQLTEMDGESCLLFTLIDQTGCKKAEDMLHQTEDRLQFIHETCRTGAWDLDLTNYTLFSSPEYNLIFGYDKSFQGWTYQSFIEHVLPEDRGLVNEEFHFSIENRNDWTTECRIRRIDRQVRWVSIAGRHQIDPSGKTVRLAGVVQDITERKNGECEAERLIRLYAALSQINQAIVHVQTPEDLAREVTRVAVDVGGFKLAWVGQNDSQTSEVIPLGWAGQQQELIHNFTHTSSGSAEHLCFCSQVIRENRSYVENNLSGVQGMHVWMSAIEQANIHAVAVFPVRIKEAVWGVFGVFSSEPDVFRDKEISLLEEAAMDIGYVIEHLENETQRRQGEKLQLLSASIMGVLNSPLSLVETSNAILKLIRQESGLDAVGIRLKDGDDFPYFSNEGFDKEFLLAENSVILRSEIGAVCRDKEGKPCLECTCGMVLSEKCGPPSDMVTPNGSVWTNNTLATLETLRGHDPRLKPRDRCTHDGFRSVALIPIRVDQQIIGLLHLNDRRKGCFTPEKIHFFEGLAATFGIAVKRKQTEYAIRESEERFRALFEQAAVGVAEIESATGRFLRVNKRYCDIAGYTHEEMMGLNFHVFLHSDDFSQALTQMEKLKTGTIREFSMDNRYYRKDGSRVWITLTVSPLWLKDRTFTRYVAVVEDITQRKEAEEALQFKNIILSTEQEVSLDGILILDHNMKPLMCNRRFIVMWGLSAGSVENRVDEAVLDLMISRIPDSDAFRKQIRHFCECREETSQDQIVLSDGRTFDLYSAPMLSLEKQYYGRVWYFRDVTEHLRLEAQFQQAQKMEAIGRLAGGVAHDFNNMLGIILGYGEILLEQIPSENPLRENVKIIVDAVQRSSALTRQLLAFARKQTLQPEIVKLNDIVRNFDKMLRRIIGEDIDLKLMLSDDIGFVLVDRGQIEQVITNLAVNARDAMPNGGNLIIETKSAGYNVKGSDFYLDTGPGKYTILSVADTGCGMDKKVLSQIFEPFFTTKEIGRGTGLGLSTVYGIVKQSNGNIRVNSEPGHGTTFEIYFPQTDLKPALKNEGDMEIAPRGAGQKILVVEDESGLRNLLETSLTGMGYKVTTAANGSEAIMMIEERGFNPDMIITDVIMPTMSGKELVERMRKHRPYLKVLFMSGYTDHFIAEHGTIDPEIPFIQKPFTLRDIGIKMQEILKKVY